ncbi:non-heme halogenase [Microthyrium microscopicum]|uniref:Non-heme halogenase n=1 Tax=Microthyrium microscopicum TaxID=703497 RepID=A0A6A6U6R3_9PEZI|nr:non-heme halogenase [Microthyrium microscopicum]
MEIPEKCSVLVVGGGPAGSYAATLLAREGIDTVLLEADKFPRYHIGESMLPSIRHFFKLIDLDSIFDSHGFRRKKGAAFKLNHSLPPSYTDFVAAGGSDGYAYNVVRSEADDILFKHARNEGAKVFDGVKVDDVQFAPFNAPRNVPVANAGRPVSASWTRKDNGTRGMLKFEYLIDASGRAGLISTKYLKNRHYNQGLKSVANWGYWKNAGTWGIDTHQEGAPFFEALEDGSGWAWFIPLHNGTTSVGVVMKQSILAQKKAQKEYATTKYFYQEALKLCPNIIQLISGTESELVTEIKSASDWSYNASVYSCPYTRIAGDAGCFIDPFFSSGYHIALTTGLSAAATVCASIKKELNEISAASWHSKNVIGTYSRFLLVIMSSMKQIHSSKDAILNDWDEESFDRAFAFFRPIIQGTVDADTRGKVTKEEISNTVSFCSHAFEKVYAADKESVLQKIKGINLAGPTTSKTRDEIKAIEAQLNDGEKQALDALRARPVLRFEHSMNIDSFNFIVIDGLKLSLQRGSLGLVKAAALSMGPTQSPGMDVMGIMMGDGTPVQELQAQPPKALEEENGIVKETGAESDKLVEIVTSVWTKVTSFFWSSLGVKAE